MKNIVWFCLMIALVFAVAFGLVFYENGAAEDNYRIIDDETLIEWYIDWEHDGEDLMVKSIEPDGAYINYWTIDINSDPRYFGSVDRDYCANIYRLHRENG